MRCRQIDDFVPVTNLAPTVHQVIEYLRSSCLKIFGDSILFAEMICSEQVDEELPFDVESRPRVPSAKNTKTQIEDEPTTVENNFSVDESSISEENMSNDPVEGDDPELLEMWVEHPGGVLRMFSRRVDSPRILTTSDADSIIADIVELVADTEGLAFQGMRDPTNYPEIS